MSSNKIVLQLHITG